MTLIPFPILMGNTAANTMLTASTIRMVNMAAGTAINPSAILMLKMLRNCTIQTEITGKTEQQ